MGIISLEKADRLFWLGRYTERVFTTLQTFFDFFDKILDEDDHAYVHFCEELAIPVIYSDKDDFIHQYLFTKEDPNSVYNNMLRAFDNGVVLRDELGSRTLSYIQMALDRIEKAAVEFEAPLIYNLQPVIDDIFAFWGCLDDQVGDEECRNIIKCGRYLERLDLYIRLGYSYPSIEKEFNKFLNRLHKIRIGYNLSEVDRLTGIINMGEEWESRRHDALGALWNIF